MVLKEVVCQELRVDLHEERQVDGVAMMCGKDVLVHDLDIRENCRFGRVRARGDANFHERLMLQEALGAHGEAFDTR